MDQGQVDNFIIDILLESTLGSKGQKESVSPFESFTESLIKTIIESLDVPRADQPF